MSRWDKKFTLPMVWQNLFIQEALEYFSACLANNLESKTSPHVAEIYIFGPVHIICSRYTTPAKCSCNKFSVHER